MKSLVMRVLVTLQNDRHGVTALEYSMIGALAAVAIIASVRTYAAHMGVMFTTISSSF